MRVAHLYPKYHRNVGDHLVQRGILRLLRRHLGEFEYTPMPTRLLGPDPDEPLGISSKSVEVANRHDLLVIGGSNLYETQGDRWGVTVDAEALRRLSVPVLLLGIGGGWSFAYPTFPLLAKVVADDLRALHAKSCGSSVRDHLTQRLLTGYGIGPSTVTGCPAMYLASESLRPAGKGVVGVPFLPKRMYAGPTANPRKWRNPKFLRRRAITRLFQELRERLPAAGYQVRVLVHDEADLDLAREMLGSNFFYSEEPEKLFDAISECDVIVGFRLHACIPALGLGIPCVPILLDGRNAAFAETFGLTEHAVPIDPAAAAMTVERVELAMGEGRVRWKPALARRDELRASMEEFLQGALKTADRRLAVP
jgi:polysaccharide pyruvyl transferase WcaK-like protein